MSMPDNGKLSAFTSSREERLETIWAKLEARGITEQDIYDALIWARQQTDDDSLNEEVALLLRRG
jgi:hypothetical protein